MSRPTVLVAGGIDPSGGAGLAADVQTATALGAHPAPVAALITVQDTADAHRAEALAAELVAGQAAAVLADVPVAAVKLGALGGAAIGTALAELLAAYPDIPVVTDPVLAASGGGRIARPELLAVYRERLLPLTLLATPNRAEFEALGGETALDTWFERGLRACVVTGGDEAGVRVRHILYTAAGRRELDAGPRLAGGFHGTGCTFATAVATRIALGDSLGEAIAAADAFVRKSLMQAFNPGRGRAVPGRW